MANIIAGRFHTQAEADVALAGLSAAGFDSAAVSIFYTAAPGQHDLQPLGGDAEHHSEGTKKAGMTAAAGTAIGGVTGLAIATAAAAAVAPGLAAVAAAAGAGVGAYAGSLAGGLSGSRQSDPDKATHDEPAESGAGLIVAARADLEGDEERAIRVLRESGALDVERADGEWVDGTWADFDPRREMNRIQ